MCSSLLLKEQLVGMNEWHRHRPEIITSFKSTFEN
jgi:hypothetical protein